MYHGCDRHKTTGSGSAELKGEERKQSVCMDEGGEREGESWRQCHRGPKKLMVGRFPNSRISPISQHCLSGWLVRPHRILSSVLLIWHPRAGKWFEAKVYADIPVSLAAGKQVKQTCYGNPEHKRLSA